MWDHIWIIKKAEHQRIGAFELCCWRRLLRVPWTARRSNQSILKEINPEYSLEGLMLKSWLIGLDRDTGKDWGQEEQGVIEDEMFGWYHWLNGHEFEQTLGDSEGHGSLACCSSLGHKELDVTYWLNSNNICLIEVPGLALLCETSKGITRGPLRSRIHGALAIIVTLQKSGKWYLLKCTDIFYL